MQKNLIEQPGCKIIPFPGLYTNQLISSQSNPNLIKSGAVINGRPGEKLPENIPDFRPYLQRDGLILLSWDRRLNAKGALYTAYWVTSSGIHRYYASPALLLENFANAMPIRKSYAAEDGIDFYGETGPLYIVHVAPELMMSNPRHGELRLAHINALKQMGSDVDFDYKYLLKTDKKRNQAPGKPRGKNNSQAGA